MVLYLGKGHNAGDAFVAARHLQAKGWAVERREVAPPEDCSPLTQKKRAECLASARDGRECSQRPLVLLDGLLGIGASGELRGAFKILACEMNDRRKSERAKVVAIDLPTGLDGETLTIAFVKTGLLVDRASGHVGKLEVIPLPEITAPPGCRDPGIQVLTREWARQQRLRRPVDHYKNRAGQVAILAGSIGYTGAAALTAEAALSAGAGLVSLHVDPAIYPILAMRCPPEIMIHPLPNSWTAASLTEIQADVFALGPGLGSSASAEYLKWLEMEVRPVVVDADGLNLLARHPERRRAVAQAGPRLLTPHPGEFDRLFPESATLPTRRERAEAIASNYSLTLLYKGARTVIAEKGKVTNMNLTGNPGMATGGMGDVLTGIAVGLLAQGYAPHLAASFAAWLAGRAADHAIESGAATEETLRPTDVIRHLTAGFQEVE